jgi:uncharacterized protein YjiS (DUF1127 family)
MSLSPACGALTGAMPRRAANKASANKPSAGKAAAKKAWAFLASLSFALAGRYKKLSTALRHRRELEQLAGSSDRMLRDLALTRYDIAFALSEPFWRDPAVVLRQARQPLVETEAAESCDGPKD